jgi:hypothetical protein
VRGLGFEEHWNDNDLGSLRTCEKIVLSISSQAPDAEFSRRGAEDAEKGGRKSVAPQPS